jgi:hypothetical protein
MQTLQTRQSRRMKWSSRLGALVASSLLVVVLSSCQRAPPEDRLRAAVKDLQTAIQERDAALTRDGLAEDFVGPEGLDRDGATRLAQLMFLRHRNVDVALGPMQVDMQADHATVAFTAVLTGGTSGLLPDSGRIYKVRTGWRLEDNEWRLTSAHWTARGGG